MSRGSASIARMVEFYWFPGSAWEPMSRGSASIAQMVELESKHRS
ncbi:MULTISPECIES: hypothetical protein [unclassified Microcoleus]